MQITVKLFGQLAHLADGSEVMEDAAEGASLPEVLDALAGRFEPAFGNIIFDETRALRGALMVLVNEAPVDKSTPPSLQDGDTVTIIPAISGG